MRIAHVITKLDLGGAQRVMCALTVEQRAQGHEVRILTGELGPWTKDMQAIGASVVHIPQFVHLLEPKNDVRCIAHLRKEFRAWKPDVVHCHSSKGGLLGRIAAFSTRIPALYTAHGWPFQAGANRKQRIQSAITEFAAGLLPFPVVCISLTELRAAERAHIATAKRRKLVRNGIEDTNAPTTHDQSTQQRRGRSTFELVTVMRLLPPKRLDVLIEALALLPAHIRLTVIGSGDLQTGNEKLANSLNLTDRITFAGWIDPAPTLTTADLFVLASDYEGVPMTILEACRAGLPIVVNDLPSVRETLAGTGASVVPLSPQSFAAAIAEFAESPERLLRTGTALRSMFQRTMTSKRMSEEYFDLYREAMRA